MVVKSMPINTSLVIKRLRAIHPQLRFEVADEAYYSSRLRTIFYVSRNSDKNVAILLHEVGHALLGHYDFSDDIALLRCESNAWKHATGTLAPLFGIVIDDEIIQDHLETYRDWLHKRSLCPRCDQTGLQIDIKLYNCINCNSHWKVNEARMCRLKRQLTK